MRFLFVIQVIGFGIFDVFVLLDCYDCLLACEVLQVEVRVCNGVWCCFCYAFVVNCGFKGLLVYIVCSLRVIDCAL